MLLAPSVAHQLYIVQSDLQLNTIYSSLRAYFTNLVEALGKAAAPTAVQSEEVAGGGM